ncbi:MAG: hypothetical protein Q9167_006798 [Letrouitia subvulpina]
MQGFARPEGLDLPQSKDQRRPSFASDKRSLSTISLTFPPSANPDPAYIGSSAASEIVAGYYQYKSQDLGIGRPGSPGTINATVSSPALLLVNAFLDQLLFNFLASSRSTSIASLRPAVSEVLKPRLAKEAIASADEELQEFLGGGDDEEFFAFHNGQEPKGDWDLGFIWRRTRLRCMVYTRWGDMEEEDEEAWLEQEALEGHSEGQHRISRDLGMVSPAAAIFLTSILEFIGEQCLNVAGEAASTRLAARRQTDKFSSASVIGAYRPTVEAVDMEKIAVSTALGRLWRSWKKRVRSPSGSSQRPTSRELLRGTGTPQSTSASTSRNASISEAGGLGHPLDYPRRSSIPSSSRKELDPALIPLPMSADDINEIENPRPLLSTFRPNKEPGAKERPVSMLLPSEVENQIRIESAPEGVEELLAMDHTTSRHIRSSSVPTPVHTPFSSPLQEEFSTPNEAPEHRYDAGAAASFPREVISGLVQKESGHPSKTVEEVTTMYDGTVTMDDGQPEEHMPQQFSQEKASVSRDSSDSEIMTLDGRQDSPADNAEKPLEKLNEQPVGLAQSLSIAASGDHRMRNESILSAYDDNEELTGRNQASATATQGPSSEGVAFGVGDAESAPELGASSSVIDENTEYDPYASHGTPYAVRQSLKKADPLDRHGSAGGPTVVPFPSSVFAQAKPAVKVSDIKRQLPPVNTAAVERATVQRVSPSPISAVDTQSPIGRTSTSSSRELRPTHTSSSSTSQKAQKLKGLIGRESHEGNRQSSDEGGSILGDRRSLKTPKTDETQRSFDQLIRSDETIQYTLTPQSMRELDSPDSPSYSHRRSETADLADFIRKSGPSEETNRPSTGRSVASLKGLSVLRSNPTSIAKPTSPPTSVPELPKQEAQAEKSRPVTARSAHSIPRDARLEKETTRDFADFIRSTGPENQPEFNPKERYSSPSASKERPTKTLASNRSTSGTSTSRKITKQNPSLSKSPPPVQPAPPKRTSSKLEAREATYEKTHNEDLLDFLRQGPAEDQGNDKRPVPSLGASVVPQNPRLPNSFRDNGRSSVASTLNSSLADKSIKSANSRTGLLDNPRSPYNLSPTSQKVSRTDDTPQPARKSRRPKDPYAIDTDSEDDENYPSTPKPRAQEESLIDFLNSTPPYEKLPPLPSSSFSPTPESNLRNGRAPALLPDHSSPPTSHPSSSSPSGRSASNPPIVQSSSDNTTNNRGRRNETRIDSAPQLPPFNPRESSPHLISTIGTKLDTYKPTQPTYAAHVDRERRGHSSGNVRAAGGLNGTGRAVNGAVGPGKGKKPAPRGEREAGGTSDLADFFKNSEPPTQVPREVRAGLKDEVEEKEAGGLRGLWGRRKRK